MLWEKNSKSQTHLKVVYLKVQSFAMFSWSCQFN